MITITKRWIISSCLPCVKGTEILRVRIPFLLESSEQESVKVETQRHKDAQDAQRHPRGLPLPTQGLPPSLQRPRGRPGTHDATVPGRGCSCPARRYRPILAAVSLTLARFPLSGGGGGGYVDGLMPAFQGYLHSQSQWEVAKMTPERAGPTAERWSTVPG